MEKKAAAISDHRTFFRIGFLLYIFCITVQNGIKKAGTHHLNPADNIKFPHKQAIFLQNLLTYRNQYNIIESIKEGEPSGKQNKRAHQAGRTTRRAHDKNHQLGRLDFNSYQTFPLRVGAQAPFLTLSIPNCFPKCNHEKRYSNPCRQNTNRCRTFICPVLYDSFVLLGGALWEKHPRRSNSGIWTKPILKSLSACKKTLLLSGKMHSKPTVSARLSLSAEQSHNIWTVNIPKNNSNRNPACLYDGRGSCFSA